MTMYDSDQDRDSVKTLKEELRDPDNGQKFRGLHIGGVSLPIVSVLYTLIEQLVQLSKGHGQGKSDDLSELQKVPGHLGINRTSWHGVDTLALLMTQSLLESARPEELHEQL
ncbi:hypothetical protein BDV93DRAFT_564781 [Ceratobasidium sp. AG-I]|nr:hypothetical protein BDV93DRAFT_564781 [Ceratobasidium sp. AG-I]